MSPSISRRRLLTVAGTGAGAAAVTGVPALVSPTPAMADTYAPVEGFACGEPDTTIAARWWIPADDVWSPIGWKDHMFRFNQFYNGYLICDPYGPSSVLANKLPYKGMDF